MLSMVVASIDADGPIIKHIQSAHPAANPTASYSTRTFHSMIRVDLSDTFARLIIAHVLLVSVTHGNPSLMEISPSDEQFWPIYPSLAEIPRVTDSTSDVCKISHSWNLEVV